MQLMRPEFVPFRLICVQKQILTINNVRSLCWRILRNGGPVERYLMYVLAARDLTSNSYIRVWFGRLNTFQPAGDTLTQPPPSPLALARNKL